MVNLLSRTLTEKGMIANSSAIAVMPYVTIRVVLLLGMPPHRRGLANKLMRMPEDAQFKIQETYRELLMKEAEALSA